MGYKKITAISVVALLAACGGGGSGDSSARSSSINSEFLGSWSSGCYLSFDSSAFQVYSIEVFEVSQDVITIYQSGHYDSGCTQLIDDAQFELEYSLGDIVTTQSGLEAVELDVIDTEEDDIDYQIIYIDGDFLYFGVEAVNNPNNRTNIIDFDFPLTRVD